MKSDFTPQEVAAWLRERAEKFKEMADYLELSASTPTGNSSTKLTHRGAAPILQDGSVTLDEIKKYLTEKRARVPDLAKHFRVPTNSITTLLTPDSGVTVGDRGWLKL